jgi:Holliday junction resolvasome RuvABC endonuclease subunit
VTGKMNVLALDLAERTGWAVRSAPWGFQPAVESGEQVHAEPNDEGRDLCYRQGLRLRRFRAWLAELLPVGGPPWLVAYERPIIFPGRPAGAIAAHQYEGVLLALLAEREVPHVAVSPSTLKKHATGSGRAEKGQMVEAARWRWGLRADGEELGHDQADALCVLAWVLDVHLGEPA